MSSIVCLPRKAANTVIVNNNDQITIKLPDFEDPLTLCCCSICHGCICNMPSFHLAYDIINGVLVAFLSCSCTFCFITRLFSNNTYIYPSKYTLKCPLIEDNYRIKNPVSVNQCSSPLSGLLNWLLSSANIMSALLPRSR